MNPRTKNALRAGAATVAILGSTAFLGQESGSPDTTPEAAPDSEATGPGLPTGPGTQEQILRGRLVVASRGCPDCHRGIHPEGEGWLGGMQGPEDEFLFGNCAVERIERALAVLAGDGGNEAAIATVRASLEGLRQQEETACYRTRPRNLTPDNLTGMGRFTERQIFNALRYGLRPGETPDVEITSTVPGEGNFPAHPKYLAPPMPWPSFRHMPDEDIWAAAAYLKHAVRPVSNRVPDSEGPPDFWTSFYTVENIGPYPLPPFPTENEVTQR